MGGSIGMRGFVMARVFENSGNRGGFGLSSLGISSLVEKGKK